MVSKNDFRGHFFGVGHQNFALGDGLDASLSRVVSPIVDVQREGRMSSAGVTVGRPAGAGPAWERAGISAQSAHFQRP